MTSWSRVSLPLMLAAVLRAPVELPPTVQPGARPMGMLCWAWGGHPVRKLCWSDADRTVMCRYRRGRDNWRRGACSAISEGRMYRALSRRILHGGEGR